MPTTPSHVTSVSRIAGAFVPAALCALLLAGCGGGSSTGSNNQVNIINGSNGLGGSTINPAGDGKSGFTGHAYLIPGSTTSTATTPVGGATIVAQLGDGTVVGRATTDGSGKYTIPLVPGTFLLTAQNVSATETPVAPAQNYRVSTSAYTTVDFSYISTK